MKTVNALPFLMAALLLVALGTAEATPPNVRVNSVRTNLQNEEQIWVSPNNANIVIANWRDWRLGYRRIAVGVSTNGGTTWSDSLVRTTFFNRQSDPCLVGDRLGNFYMNMLDYDAGSSNTNSYISVWRSTNNGTTWTGPVSVEQDIGFYFEDKQFTAVDRTGGPFDGNYYVSWSRFPNPTRIMFVRSTDGAATFGDTLIVGPSPNVPDCGGLQDAGQFSIPIVDADGYVHVFWQGYKFYPGCVADYAIRHVYSTDGGVTFTTNSPDSIALINDMGYNYVDGSVDTYGMPNGDCDISSGPYRNTIYIAQTQFATGFSDRTDVIVRKSTDHGATWSDRAVVNDDDSKAQIDQFHPWIAVNEDGVLLVIFYDQRNDPVNHYLFDTYFSASFDGGETYIHNQRISDTSVNPSLAISERALPTTDAPRRKSKSMPGSMVIMRNPPRSDPKAGKFAEYIGIHARRDTITCIWTDTRGGNQDAYSAHFLMPFVQPRLYYPADKDSSFLVTPACRWSTCWHEGDDEYRLEMSKDSTFTTIDRVYAGLSDNNFTVPVALDSAKHFWRVKAFKKSANDSTGYSEVFTFGRKLAPTWMCGDADGNKMVNISDAVWLISYVFSGGPAPEPLVAGDVDCNGMVNITDAVYLIAYIFGGGAAPCASCP
jgi:hypothetical protein